MSNLPRKSAPSALWLQRPVFAGLLFSTALLLLSFQPAKGDELYARAVGFYNKRDYKEALKTFAALKPKANQIAGSYYYQGLCYQQMGDFSNARRYFSAITLQFPEDPAAKLAVQALDMLDAKNLGGAVPAVDKGLMPMKAGPQKVVVPFTKLGGGHMLLKVWVNGKSVPAIFDTGAEVCAFRKSLLNQAGVDTRDARKAGYVEGVGGQMAVLTMPVELSLGAIVKPNMLITIQEDDNDPTSTGSSNDYALLGQTFFAGLSYIIDDAAGTITFFAPNSPESRLSSDMRRSTSAVPFSWEGRSMIVKPKINGRECDCIFDTGAGTLNFSDKQLSGLGINRPTNAGQSYSVGVGGKREGFAFALNSVELGGVKRSGVLASIALYSAIAKPLFGQSFLKGLKYGVYPQDRMIYFFSN